MPSSVPTTIDGVLDRLRTIQRALPARDGVAVFNRVYLDVTERVAAAIDADDFADDAFMVELDVRFAIRWLLAYDAVVAGRTPPSAWKPLFEERGGVGVLPIQHALAGMNAHIEHDLPLAVVETCRVRRTYPSAAVRKDYDRVNDVLALVESEIRRSFLTTIGKRVDQEFGPVVHLISAWNIDKARDIAWVNVEALWTMRGELQPLFGRYVAMLSHTVGMGSRILLTPVTRGIESVS